MFLQCVAIKTASDLPQHLRIALSESGVHSRYGLSGLNGIDGVLPLHATLSGGNGLVVKLLIG